MIPATEEKLMKDLYDELVELQKLVNQLIERRNNIGELQLELTVQDHSVCLKILKTVDELTMNH